MLYLWRFCAAFILLFIGEGCVTTRVEAVSAALCPTQLGPAIDAIADQPQFQRARWGMLVQTLDGGGNSGLYERDAQKFFLPASTAKLLTTAAALKQLGPQFRIQTPFYGTGSAPRLARLRVVGRGDPSLTDASLQQIAQTLQQQGIMHIQQLTGEDVTFSGSVIVPSWEWQDLQSGDGLPVNRLILNQNVVRLRLTPQQPGQSLGFDWVSPGEAVTQAIDNRSRTVGPADPEFVDVSRTLDGSRLEITGQLRAGAEPEIVDVPVDKPGWHFLNRFRQILAAQQIGVEALALDSTAELGGVSSDLQGSERLLAQVTSPSLVDLMIEINQMSNNLGTEVLLHHLGQTRVAPALRSAAASTLEQGLLVLSGVLAQLGVDPSSYRLVDGSGLSRQNLVSPEALVATLRGMARSPDALIFRHSLPQAGVSGTLKARFQQTPAQGILWAKTGTLRGVAGLAGYVNSPQFQPVVFSILVNQSDQPTEQLRQAVDAIAILISRLQSC